jgi:hypothetical protein
LPQNAEGKARRATYEEQLSKQVNELERFALAIFGFATKSPHVSSEAGLLMEVQRVADAQEMAGSSLRASFDDPYFRIAKINRPNLFDPCFSAKRPKIKQFGRLISA